MANHKKADPRKHSVQLHLSTAELEIVNTAWREFGFASRNDFIATAAVNEARQTAEGIAAMQAVRGAEK
jgi:uncharacterized protein (DUF1778 family)